MRCGTLVVPEDQLTGKGRLISIRFVSARWWRYVCTLIPSPGAAARYGQQPRSPVPVLMINGSDDPHDPPANMAGARRIWPNSREVVEPGQGHDIGLQAWLQCDAGLMQTFVERPARRA